MFRSAAPEHKGISDERRGDIRDLRCSEHGVVRATAGHMQWRCTCVDTDRPDVLYCHEQTLYTLSVCRTGTRGLHQAVDLFISKASHFAGFTRDADRHLIGWSVLSGATEVEQLINMMLKIERHLPPRGSSSVSLRIQVLPIRTCVISSARTKPPPAR